MGSQSTVSSRAYAEHTRAPGCQVSQDKQKAIGGTTLGLCGARDGAHTSGQPSYISIPFHHYTALAVRNTCCLDLASFESAETSCFCLLSARVISTHHQVHLVVCEMLGTKCIDQVNVFYHWARPPGLRVTFCFVLLIGPWGLNREPCSR